MNAGFGFWDFVTLAVFIALVTFAVRAARWLGNASERLVMILVRVGLHGAAKAALWLIGYDRATYRKSRMSYWNAVSVRFALFWGALMVWAGLLHFLKEGRTINAVSPYWGIGVAAFVAHRLLMAHYADQNDQADQDQRDSTEVFDDMNSNEMRHSRNYSQLVRMRQWDYLDDLFHI
ncbi:MULTISPECIES: hypothetical protein [Larkinella]|jgi:hypothetical protein|uniref:Uncharacterized protein n=1 Tax=Larkinella punicea TaxID=2315727 RepID=A0A368JJ32_9BACT|nr:MULTISPECIES: hypothetical protein [Larkinella]RCR67066.1 hypothetical protein DUE52_23710 [Larkinella punicea]